MSRYRPEITMHAPGVAQAASGESPARKTEPVSCPGPDDDTPAGYRPSRALEAPPHGYLAVDDHAVTPETRWELIDGKRVYASPAKAPHGDNHFNLDYVLRAHVASDYVGSTDLLTRWDNDNDYATDSCIRKRGINPVTDRRYLEEVVFEVANTQSPGNLVKRAQTLAKRGVRRVFAIFVQKGMIEGAVKEWSQAQQAFVPLALDRFIEDPCFVRPLKVRAVLDAATADDEVADALIARRNPRIEEYRDDGRKKGFDDGRKKGFDDGRKEGFDDGRKEGFDDGRKEGQQRMLLKQLGLKFGQLEAFVRERVAAGSYADIERWAERVLTADSLDDVFIAP